MSRCGTRRRDGSRGCRSWPRRSTTAPIASPLVGRAERQAALPARLPGRGSARQAWIRRPWSSWNVVRSSNGSVAELCDAVTGRADSREMLSAIDRRNLFISPLDEDRRWFRLHHLFAEVLSARLKDDHAEDLPVLHRKASDWYDSSSPARRGDQPPGGLRRRWRRGRAHRPACQLADEARRADGCQEMGRAHFRTRSARTTPRSCCSEPGHGSWTGGRWKRSNGSWTRSGTSRHTRCWCCACAATSLGLQGELRAGPGAF